jgi:hypothetical protein
VHDHERRAGAGAHVGDRSSRRPLTSLTIEAPGGDGGLGDRGLVGVDGDERVELAGDPLDERRDARDLLVGRDRRAGR